MSPFWVSFRAKLCKAPINLINSLGILARNHPKSSKIHQHAVKKSTFLLDFDGFGTVANAKHPWLGYTQSWIQQKQPVEFDGFCTHGYMLNSLGYTCTVLNPPTSIKTVQYSWLGYRYTQSWIQQNQPVEFDGFCTHGYMLNSLGYTCTVLNPPTSIKTVKYSWLGYRYTQSCNPTKAAGGVWWILYTWLHAQFTGLYMYSTESTNINQNCTVFMAWLQVYTVLNPTKPAGGVWWILYTWLHAQFTGLYMYSTESTNINQNCKVFMAWLQVYTVL